jgi:hypothetical protein
MTLCMRIVLCLALLSGCGDGEAPPARVDGGLLPPPRDAAASAPPDLARAAADLSTPAIRDLSESSLTDLSLTDLSLSDSALVDLAPPADAVAPVDGAPADLARAPGVLVGRTLLAGQDVLDASVDQGGGIWAVTSSTVFYFPPGRATPFTYDQASGLARGWRTWTDTYYSPGTWPVTFTSVAGATSGQALVGNVGAIGDRLEVDPASGAVIRVDNMLVDPQYVTPPSEIPAQLERVVATHKIVVDLDGTWYGTAYVGGWHGFSAFHGLERDCGCVAFEQHLHYQPPSGCDSSPATQGCWDGDVRGLAITSDGDVWAGDRHFVQLLPQRSHGPFSDFFQGFADAIDVWPGTRDEVDGLAVDAAGGVYVASDGNGLAYLAPATHTPAAYWSALDRLPVDNLRGVVLDQHGDAWIGTQGHGVVRYRPASSAWAYFASVDDGLPSPDVNTVNFDALTGQHQLLIATSAGLGIYVIP